MAFGWIPSHEVVDGLAKAALGHSEVDFKVAPGVKDLVVVAEELMLEKWQLRWNNDVKGWLFYAID